MTIRNTLIAAAAVLMLTAGTAFAQPGGMGMSGRGMNQGHEGPGQMDGSVLNRMLPMLHHLDLTSEQTEQIREIVEEARSEIEYLRESEESEGFREQFKEVFSSSTISQSEVEALLNARLDSMAEANTIIAAALVDIHDVLTDEQLEMIADFEPPETHERGMNRSASSRGGHHQDR